MSSHAAAEPSGEYTWDDFIRLEDDDLRELIDGKLVEVEVPKELHERVVAVLAMFLGLWARSHGGRVLGSGYKVRITAKRGVMPDVQLFRPGNLAGLEQQDGLEQGHPDLVVEVVSPSSRRYDRVTKLAWHAAIAVPEYWIIDPDAHTVERLVLDGERYQIADALGESDTFQPASFEGLVIPLGELWASGATTMTGS